MIDAHRIVYNNLSSEEFDVTLHLSFGSENGASNSFLNREAISTEVYDGSRKFIHGSKYTDSATPRFTLIKQNFGDFSPEENRRVLSWLTSNSKPSWLEVYQDDSNVLSYKYFCVPTTVEQYKLSNGRVVGYEFEIFSDAPYAWSRKLTYPEVFETVEEITTNDESNDCLTIAGTKEFTITCESDEYNKLLYPKVTITFNDSKPEDIYFPVTTNPMDSTYAMIPNVLYSYNNTLYVNINQGDINDQGKFAILQNLSTDTVASGDLVGGHYYFPLDKTVKKVAVNTDGVSYTWKTVSIIGAAVKINNPYTLNGKTISKEAIIAGGAPGETIILDGTNKVISSATSNQLKIIGDDFNWEWPSLITGENVITVTGNCKIKFEWLEPRKVGSL